MFIQPVVNSVIKYKHNIKTTYNIEISVVKKMDLCVDPVSVVKSASANSF